MKKVSIFLIISILSLCCLFAEVSQKALATSFTAAGECFTGFSRKNVTTTIKLQETEKYSENGIISFTFDPVGGFYYTDVFYAYCQSFVNSPLIVKVSAPAQIYNETDKTYTDAFTYHLIFNGKAYDSKTGYIPPKNSDTPPPETPEVPVEETVSGIWVTDQTTISYTHDESKDSNPKYTEPRVVLSQPILIRIPESTSIARGKKYSITFTLEVSTNA